MKRSPSGPQLLIWVWLLGTLFWWGLAFYPTAEATPEWLSVARSVCFGSLPNGLPDAAGWMVLTLGPLSFLIAGFVIWSSELKIELLRTCRDRLGLIALLVVLSAIAVEASWVVRKVSYAKQVEIISFKGGEAEDLPSEYPRTTRVVEDFNLIDQAQNPIRLADFKNETILLTFAFAHCQAVCPMLVKQAAEVGRQVANLRIFLVTLDPWRDTPKSLPFLAKKWDLPANAHILSGPVTEVLTVLDRFQVPYKRDEKTGDVAHPALVYLIEPGGTIAYTFNNPPTRWLLQAIERIEKNGHPATASR